MGQPSTVSQPGGVPPKGCGPPSYHCHCCPPRMFQATFQSWMNLVVSPQTPLWANLSSTKETMDQSSTFSVVSPKILWAKSPPKVVVSPTKKTQPITGQPSPQFLKSLRPIVLCFSFTSTYVGWSASKTCFGVAVARRPRGPLDVPIVEDDEGRLGVGGQDGLEGVALQEGRRR